jgi:zinc/manganese transport system permease protein
MFGQLLAAHFVHVALAAGIIAAVLAGLLGPLVVARNNAFAVHGIAELGLTGAAGGLLIGLDATTGALLGSVTVGLLLGVLGLRGRDRDTATGTLLAAGLGLGVLFLSKLHAYASTGFGLLFGSITAASDAQLHRLLAIAGLVAAVLALLWRPLWYASVDPDTAEARGVPTRALGVAFPVLLAVAVAETIQVTGVLLILTLVVTPAAAAHQLTTRPASAVAVSVGLAVAATIGGILASLAWNAPTSFFIATFSFTAYIGTRLISRRPAARGNSWKPSTTNPPVTNPPVTTTTTD